MKRITLWLGVVGAILVLAACGEINVIDAPGNGCSSDAECTEGSECRIGTCDVSGTCSYSVIDGSCFIDGQCYLDGQTSPGDLCRRCDAKQSNTTFLNTVCEEGECNKASGECESDPCDPDPCNENEECVNQSGTFLCIPEPTTGSWCETFCEAMQNQCPDQMDGAITECTAGCEQAATGPCSDTWDDFVACHTPTDELLCTEDNTIIPADPACQDALSTHMACENGLLDPCDENPCKEDETCISSGNGTYVCEGWCMQSCKAMFEGCPQNMNGTIEQCANDCEMMFAGPCAKEWEEVKQCAPGDAMWTCDPEYNVIPADFDCTGVVGKALDCMLSDACNPPCPAGTKCSVDPDGALTCIPEGDGFCEEMCEAIHDVCPEAAGSVELCKTFCPSYESGPCASDWELVKGCMNLAATDWDCFAPNGPTPMGSCSKEWTQLQMCLGFEPPPVGELSCMQVIECFKEGTAPCMPGTECEQSVKTNCLAQAVNPLDKHFAELSIDCRSQCTKKFGPGKDAEKCVQEACTPYVTACAVGGDYQKKGEKCNQILGCALECPPFTDEGNEECIKKCATKGSITIAETWMNAHLCATAVCWDGISKVPDESCMYEAWNGKCEVEYVTCIESPCAFCGDGGAECGEVKINLCTDPDHCGDLTCRKAVASIDSYCADNWDKTCAECATGGTVSGQSCAPINDACIAIEQGCVCPGGGTWNGTKCI